MIDEVTIKINGYFFEKVYGNCRIVFVLTFENTSSKRFRLNLNNRAEGSLKNRAPDF